VKTARTVNLRGEPQDESIAAKENSISVKLKAFAPTTLLLVNQ